MQQKDFTTTILANQTLEQVFDAIINASHRWPGEINRRYKNSQVILHQ